MIRQFALSFMVAALPLVTPPLVTPAAAQEMGGQIVCMQDARQVRDYLDANRASLSPAQVRDAEKRLDVIASQCRGQVQLGLSDLTVLRRDLQAQVEQQAQVPGNQ
jgi:hypothetical protein